MKFDIARAWKDEAYRQSLNEEQLSALPVNPVGELSDTDLAHVSGSGLGGPDDMNSFGGPDGANSFGGPNFTGFSNFNGFANIHKESVAVILCEVNIFSVSIVPILSLAPQTCIQGQ